MEGGQRTRGFEGLFWHVYLGSPFLDAEDVAKLNMGAIWNSGKGTGLL